VRIGYVCCDRGVPVCGGKGSSVHVRSITEALQERGHHVLLACARLGAGNPRPKVARVVELGADVAAHPTELAQLLETEAVDVVLERYSLDSGPALLASAGRGIPIVVEVNAPLVHEAARYRGLDNLEEALASEQRLFGAAAATVGVSRAVVAYAGQVAPGTPAYWIPNGADVGRFAAAADGVAAARPDGEQVVGFVGSMKPWHGVSDLLDAFETLASELQGARLVLIGAGPEDHTLSALIRRTSCSDRVETPGLLPHAEVARRTGMFSVGVAPFRPSPDFYFSPLKVFEYMASGIPTVYPTTGDLPDIVGGAGVGYRPGSVSGLVGALRTVLTDRELRHGLSACARDRRWHWTWSRTAERVEAVLEATLARFSSRVAG
jgi:glycosyltransferase involved in cell wall biosynthesis